ncbi:InlB B-repeat-containing protein [Ascidiimonas aurantiaca]|uniref:InlB B-repeat-containing protein n=1 Tax=Ascidiimonas aurantiaca TaxID=1685432 RepID=UPI0030ECA5D3
MKNCSLFTQFQWLRIKCILLFVLLGFTQISAQFSGGNGTYESPYEISDLTNLQYLSEHEDYWDQHFILSRDIDASNTINWNGGLGFSPIGDNLNGTRQRVAFTGTFDGRGHSISNIYSNRPNESYVGLFGALERATVENLGLHSISVTGDNNAGGLAGVISDSNIRFCFVTGTVNVRNQSSIAGGLTAMIVRSHVRESYAMVNVFGVIAGGFSGSLQDATVADCWAGGSVDAVQIAGGFSGLLNTGNLEKCYAIGRVTAPLSGGFAGFRNVNGTIEDSFFDRNSTGQTLGVGQGDILGVTALDTSGFSNTQQFTNAGWDLQAVWEIGVITTIDNITRPYLKMQLAPLFVQVQVRPRPAASVTGAGYYKSNDPVTLKYEINPRYTFQGWELEGTLVSTANPYSFPASGNQNYIAVFTENLAFEGGSGTETDPYQIATLQQLQDIHTIPSLRTQHFVLIADIDAMISKTWNQGKGFQPIGDESYPFTGSFKGQGHRIVNLYINRPQQSATGLFGYTQNASISELGLDDASITGKDYTAGIAGLDKGGSQISRCYVTGLIIGNSSIGGIMGKGTNSNVENTYSLARTYGKDTVGGIIGAIEGNSFVFEVYAAGRVLSDRTSGAIVSYRDNNTSIRGIYDRNTTNLNKGTNQGDRGTTGYTSNFFSIPLIVNTHFDMVNDWQLAYGRDNIKRPILKWETPLTIQFSSDGPGTINREAVERILSGSDFPPISAYPDPGHTFSHWLDEDTQEQWTSNPLNINQVDRNYNLKAIFTPTNGNRNITIKVINTVQVPLGDALVEWNGDLFKTDPNGIIELTNVADGNYNYTVTQFRYLPYHGALEVNGNDATIEIVLLSGYTFTDFTCDFLVTDGPTPLPNAQIIIEEQGSTPVTYTTDNLGEYRFTGNGNFIYTVKASGYESQTGTFSLVSNNTFKRIALKKAYNLQLTLTDGTNVLPQAEVICQGTTYRADNQGVVRLEELPSGTYNFTVSAPGFPSTPHSSVISDQDVYETITLTPPAGPLHTVTFRITDGLRPIPGAGILIFQASSFLGETANSQGEISFQLEQGTYTVRAFAAFYSAVEQNYTITGDTVEEVVLSGSTQSIRLGIADGNGIAISNANIEYYGRTLTTNTSGDAIIHDLVTGTSYQFTVSAPGYLTTSATILIDPIVTYYEILLSKPGEVLFECSDGTQPLAGVQLNFNGNIYTSDTQGEIRITDLSIGNTYRYRTETEDYYPITGEITLSQDVYTETLILSKKENYFQVTFEVVDALSLPIASAEINLEGKPYFTDLNGRTAVETLPDGRYPYTVNASGFLTERGALSISGNTVTEVVVLRSTTPLDFTISGTVKDNQGDALVNTQLNGFSTAVTTNANGEYTALEAQGWSGVITPSLQGYTFSPVSIEITHLRADTTRNDFIGTPVSTDHTISGVVRDDQGALLPDVTITGFSQAVTTNANGEYTALEAQGWSGVITPSLQGYTFSPVSIEITHLRADTTGNDFTGTRVSNDHTISGVVRDDQGALLPDVTITGFSQAVTTNANGEYTALEAQGWSGVIIPSLQAYTFSPVSIEITHLRADTMGNDFTGTRVSTDHTISGVVRDDQGALLPDVTITGFSQAVTTNANGEYTALEAQGWSGTIVPVLENYVFLPQDIFISNLSEDLRQDFTGRKAFGMRVFPMPSHDGYFIVSLPKKQYMEQIQIFTLLGNQVLQADINGEMDIYTVENSLPAGFYVLVLTTKDKIYEQKILIN